MPEPNHNIEELLRSNPDPFKAIDTLNKQAWELRYTNVGQSMEYSRKALELAENEQYPNGLAYARLYLAIGHFLRSENKQALELLLQARKYFNTQQDEKGYPVTLTFLGNIYESFGDYETGLNYCQQALQAARDMEYQEGEGDVLSVIGLIYSRLNDYDNALRSYQDSLSIREKMGDLKAAASSYNRIARIYTLKKEYHKALKHYEESLRIRKETGQLTALPWTYLGMASAYEEMGDMKNALEYYGKNLETGCGDVDKRCRLQCLLGSGRILYNEGDIEEASRHLDESLKMSQDLNAKPLEYETHRAFAALYESTGELRKSLEHYMEFHRIREEVYSAETQNRMKEQQIAYAVEKSEKEKEIYHLRHVELKAAYDAITDSINYASRIQAAMLPSREFLDSYLPEHFILFLPRDVVSGDFYWATVLDYKIVFAAADCTGHGVPGAFMSMLGIAFLDEIVNKRGVISASNILFDLRKEVIKALKQTGKEQEQKDGMDIALCVYDMKKKKLDFAGAYNPLFLVRKGELIEYKADRIPISYMEDMEQPYTSNKVQVEEGDTIYIFSDGYPDQFGGTDGKKFKSKALKDLLLSIQNESLYIQKQLLEKHFSEWKGDLEQIDDVILIGVRF